METLRTGYPGVLAVLDSVRLGGMEDTVKERHPPAGMWLNVQDAAKLIMQHMGKALCKYIIKLRPGRNMENLDLIESHLIVDKMKINLNMFCPLMLHRISSQILSANIVTKD
jgi:hypothetical protein